LVIKEDMHTNATLKLRGGKWTYSKEERKEEGEEKLLGWSTNSATLARAQWALD
jgi:hypothetical protein